MAFNFIAGYVLGTRQAGKAAGLAASAAQFSKTGSASDTADLNMRVDRLTLVVEAMWSILEADGHTQEELMDRIAELDAEDGSEDGRRLSPPVECPHCRAKVSRGLSVCQFCGTTIEDVDPFAV